MLTLLGVNIRQFDEGEGEGGEEDFSKYIGENGELDVESLIDDYKEPPNNQDEGDDNTPPEETDGEEKTPPTDEGEEKTPPGEGEGEEKTPPEPPKKNTPDEAFAEMRRRAEQNESLAKWVSDLAKQQGFQDPKQLIDAFEKQRLAKEAQAKGVPVDVYERLNQLEKENKQKDETMFREKFNMEVQATKDKYKLTDEQITDVFRFMGQNGYVDQNGKSTIAFEDAYTLANRDTLIKDAEERGRQAYLEEKQKQQQQATPDVGTNANDKNNKDTLLEKDPLEVLDGMGIEWR